MQEGPEHVSGDNQLREEEEDRARLLSAVRYDLSLTLSADVAAETFTSRSIVDFDCDRAGAETFLNLRAPELCSVVVNGTAVGATDHRFDGRRIRVGGLLRGHNRVEVVARCAYDRTGVGLHRFRDPVDGTVYLYTQCEPFDAHRVLACFDQPSLKAALSLHVEGPAHWTVCANAPVAGSTTHGGRTTWDFVTTPLLPPYLFALAAGDYDVVPGPAHGRVPLALLSRRSLTAHVRDNAAAFFDITLRGLAYFEDRYGQAYPFGEYNQVFVPEANMGAMENPGCVTFNEAFVFRGPVSPLQTMRRANVILHEMVHVMGFGDVVTMRDWGDLWLNETFATVEATIAADALGVEGAWVDFAGSVTSRALHQDQLSTTHPILVDALDTDSIRANFDGITYHKGASVLRQLIAWVGDEAYVAGIRSYFEEFRWGNATHDDFLAHQAAQSGRDLGEWARLWLRTAGVNTLSPAVTITGGRYRHVSVHQGVDAAAAVMRPHRVSVGLYDRRAGRLERRCGIGVEVTGAAAPVDAGDAAVAELLIANDGGLTFAKLRFDARSLDTLVHGGLSALADPLARSLCWTALHDMSRDAELAAAEFVRVVVEQAPGESEPALLERVLSLAVGIAEHHSADANRGAALAALAGLAAARLEEGGQPLIWARCLAATATGDEHLALLGRLVQGAVSVRGLAIDDELRWALLARLCAMGRAGDAEVEAARRLDPSDAGQRHALSCLAAQPSAEAKAQAWSAAFADHEPSRARLAATLGGFATGQFAVGGFHAADRDQLDLVAGYSARYLDALPALWTEHDYDVARIITECLFPREPADEGGIAAVEDAIASGSLPWNARRVLMEGRDGLRRSARARAVDSA